jgi:hypothetical protein
MKKMTITVMAAALTVSAAPALAQPGAPADAPFGRDNRVFVAVNAGGQTQSRTLDTALTLPVYGQTATASTAAGIDGGPFFDVNGEYRFTKHPLLKHVGVGAGFSTFGTTGELSGVASVPHPVFFNRHADVTIPGRDAKRSERSFYLIAVGSYRVTEEVEVTAFAGPSFLRVSQELVTAIAVPPGTQDVTTTVEKQSATGVGGIFGVDATYFVTKQIGAGAFLRFNGGSVDLPSAENVKAGGFQLGVGVRLRY